MKSSVMSLLMLTSVRPTFLHYHHHNVQLSLGNIICFIICNTPHALMPSEMNLPSPIEEDGLYQRMFPHHRSPFVFGMWWSVQTIDNSLFQGFRDQPWGHKDQAKGHYLLLSNLSSKRVKSSVLHMTYLHHQCFVQGCHAVVILKLIVWSCCCYAIRRGILYAAV